MGIDLQGIHVTVPHLAESLASATIIKWLKSPGDHVRENEALCELETDKVNVEMPSPAEGTLLRIFVQEGETAAVGAPICLIKNGEDRQPSSANPSPEESDAHRARYSPAVARLAAEKGIDLRKVKGTSLGGRINRRDILAYIAEMEKAADTPSHPPVSQGTEMASDPARDSEVYVPITQTRGVIAQRMILSAAEIPHAWMMIEADVTPLTDLRNKLKDAFEKKEGVRLTFTSFVIKAIVNAIKDYPMLNSTWGPDRITIKKEIHINVAVGSEDSVVTPVLRNADRKSIAAIAVELDDLVRRARSGKLTLNDLQGGTFTFNNTGAFGSILSYPMIQLNQAAMITFEAIVRKPVVMVHDMIAIRSMVNLCLSLDHRILDGMVCGRFLQRVKHYLEQYGPDTPIY